MAEDNNKDLSRSLDALVTQMNDENSSAEPVTSETVDLSGMEASMNELPDAIADAMADGPESSENMREERNLQEKLIDVMVGLKDGIVAMGTAIGDWVSDNSGGLMAALGAALALFSIKDPKKFILAVQAVLQKIVNFLSDVASFLFPSEEDIKAAGGSRLKASLNNFGTLLSDHWGLMLVGLGLMFRKQLLLLASKAAVMIGTKLIMPMLSSLGAAMATITVPFLLIAGAVIAAVAAVYLIVKHWDDIVLAFNNIVIGISAWARAITDWWATVDIIEPIKTSINNIIGEISLMIDSVIAWVKSLNPLASLMSDTPEDKTKGQFGASEFLPSVRTPVADDKPGFFSKLFGSDDGVSYVDPTGTTQKALPVALVGSTPYGLVTPPDTTSDKGTSIISQQNITTTSSSNTGVTSISTGGSTKTSALIEAAKQR